ncbi:type I-C CRISPR-associated protein Cas5c [Actinomadura syzygii]|uniref:pre-crRNA processing endonuclease n=1 Tax=Actinomadura syzygii TaxID=1427538 RepID=A0A5D0TW29_9ACTN|nr:type I-C CRISPR-associated protein Cas5c [Actinomadura syzygii]TYC10067.1 type I-C CRISPR-associated protein Cas5 [Actinomadura syzygii]
MVRSRPYYPEAPLVVEVSGEYACFTRPELKAERFSYEVMTPSAARGVLEAIFWRPEFEYLVVKIEVLKPIRWFSIRRNEAKSMASDDWVRRMMADPAVRYDIENDRDQRNTVALRDVAYRIHAQVRLRSQATGNEIKYREQFRRRVDKGACFSQPFLGTREFSARFGKATSLKPISETRDLGPMLHSIHYEDGGESYHWFHAELRSGVLEVPPEGVMLTGATTKVRS